MVKIFKDNLKKFRELVQDLPLDHVVYAEGSNIGQIAFHAAQSSNNFLRVHVLRIGFDRNKPGEYGEQHNLDEVNRSIDMALEACEMIEKKNPDMNEKLAKPVEMSSYTLENNMEALAFSLSHLAEHYGELLQVKREL